MDRRDESGAIRTDPTRVRAWWGTIKGVAKKLGIHRRMVREAVLSAVPTERKRPARETETGSGEGFVEAILEADRKAPRKQRHTAHRIWCRIRAEMPGVQICESTVRATCGSERSN